MEQPPDDAEAWTDEQWIEWLDATADDVEVDHRVYAPRLESRGGAVLGAAMLGLERAMFGEVERAEIVIEVEAKGQPGPVQVDLDPDDPSASTVVIES